MMTDQKLKRLRAQRLQIINAMANLDRSDPQQQDDFANCQQHLENLDAKIAELRENT